MSYKIVEHDDGTATVRSAFSGRVVGTHPSPAAAEAWVRADIDSADDREQKRARGMTTHCHYCNMPTDRGVCVECGPEI
jgi:hypothetical protein